MDYNSKNYLQSRTDYYLESLFPKDSKRYLGLIYNKENSFLTSKTIAFRNIPFMENEKNVIKLLGKPRFVLKDPYPILPVKVIFYKEKIENVNVVMQLHFFENKFFYACYTFRRWTESDLSFFKEIIFLKYLDKSDLQSLIETAPPGKPEKIRDNDNNGLIILPEVYLHFIYFSENSEIVKKMQNDEIGEEESKMLRRQFANKYF